MALGPLELLVVCFPSTRLADGVVATLERLAKAGDLRIADVLVVRTDAAGGACPVELTEIPGLPGDPVALTRLATGLITETDVDEIAELVDNDIDALAVLVEHLWVNDLAGEVAATDGTVLAVLHVPAAVIVR
ncbi:MAG: DUF6325 family protein [Actinoplanes sp.]